jgi:CheY-like chemotaxis protein
MAESSAAARNLVLVIDDSVPIRRMIKNHLDKLGLKTLSAMDGVEGLEMARRYRPQLILLDIQMTPDLDGFGVLERLRENERTSAIPVIMMTGLGSEDHVRRAVELGARGYIVKPVDVATLTQKVFQALDEGSRKADKVQLPAEPVAAMEETKPALEGCRAHFRLSAVKNASAERIMATFRHLNGLGLPLTIDLRGSNLDEHGVAVILKTANAAVEGTAQITVVLDQLALAEGSGIAEIAARFRFLLTL